MTYEYMTGMGNNATMRLFGMAAQSAAQQNGGPTPVKNGATTPGLFVPKLTTVPKPTAPTPTSAKNGDTGLRLPGVTFVGKLPTTGVTAPTTGPIVPATVPQTGIMKVMKDGKQYTLLTKRAADAKKAALRALQSFDGNRFLQWIVVQSFPTYTQILDGVEVEQPPTGALLSFAGPHADAFRGGARLTNSQWIAIDKALNPATAIIPPKVALSLTEKTQATQEAEENVEQARSVSEEANHQVGTLEAQISQLQQALADAQAAAATGDAGANADVQALQAQVLALTQQLSAAQNFADDAAADVSTAEAEYEEVAPWYRRYMWHMGIGALLLAAAGGGYWWWSRRSMTSNLSRLPVPSSPRHPAGF